MMILARALCDEGLASGFAEVRRLIGSGAIKVNGRVAMFYGEQVEKGDTITVGKHKRMVVEKGGNTMKHFDKTTKGWCHECDHETSWRVEHRFVYYHGITHVLVCEECGMEVPDFTFGRYQEEGRIVIPV